MRATHITVAITDTVTQRSGYNSTIQQGYRVVSSEYTYRYKPHIRADTGSKIHTCKPVREIEDSPAGEYGADGLLVAAA